MKVAEQLALNVMPSNNELPHKRLTERESEIFNLLAQGKSISSIAASLHLSVKTVSTHKANILNKMGLNSISEIVQYALSHNLIERFDA
jgi:DNA-binding NarL/FixJ family response regulator